MTIPANCHLTIEDMTLHFGMNGGILIENGGSLEIRGTTLTGNDECETMWKGVQVSGTGTVGNSDVNAQGIFKSTEHNGNWSKIEQALFGVSTGYYTGAGGVINIDHTYFHNNFYGIVMNNHNSNANYFSTIQACHFEKTGNGLWYPYTGENPRTHVALKDIRGVSDLVINNGSGTTHNLFKDAEYGLSGIDIPNVDLANADFVNCTFGISSYRTNPSPTQHDFTGLTFDNCKASIKLVNTLDDNIQNCIFNINSNAQIDNFYGIFLDAATNFHINDNIFNRLTYGVWVNNSSYIGGRISSNNTGNLFDKCWRGVNTRGGNPTLQIKCNTFKNDLQPDLEYSAAWVMEDELADQGLQSSLGTAPAGNQFFRSGSRNDIYALPGVLSPNCNATNFCYNHHTPSSCPSCVPLLYTPLTVKNNNTLANKSSTSCIGVGVVSIQHPTAIVALIELQTDSVSRQLMTNDLIQYYVSNNQPDQAISFLNTHPNLPNKIRLFQLYLAQGNSIGAQGILNYLCNLSDNSSQDFCQLGSIQLSWLQNNLSSSQMTSAQEQQIRNVAEHTTFSSGLSKGLIKKVFGEDIGYPVYPDTNIFRRADENLSANVFETSFKLYPNPVITENLYLELADVFLEKEIHITAYNTLGEKNYESHFPARLENFLQIKSLHEGIYQFVITVENQLFRQAVIISHR